MWSLREVKQLILNFLECMAVISLITLMISFMAAIVTAIFFSSLPPTISHNCPPNSVNETCYYTDGGETRQSTCTVHHLAKDGTPLPITCANFMHNPDSLEWLVSTWILIISFCTMMGIIVLAKCINPSNKNKTSLFKLPPCPGTCEYSRLENADLEVEVISLK